ncbi:MAG: V-type ATP synthase subunit B, partial [Oscillospiraceae bacterium]|nr:V-type ATP synthase subunit B [Oscillospiraceae bacterium]
MIALTGIQEINGPLLALDGVRGAGYDEVVRLDLVNGTSRLGKVAQLDGERCVVQVFEGTNALSLSNVSVSFSGHPMELSLSPEILGRTFSGSGTPLDHLGPIYASKKANIN